MILQVSFVGKFVQNFPVYCFRKARNYLTRSLMNSQAPLSFTLFPTATHKGSIVFWLDVFQLIMLDVIESIVDSICIIASFDLALATPRMATKRLKILSSKQANRKRDK